MYSKRIVQDLSEAIETAAESLESPRREYETYGSNREVGDEVLNDEER